MYGKGKENEMFRQIKPQLLEDFICTEMSAIITRHKADSKSQNDSNPTIRSLYATVVGFFGRGATSIGEAARTNKRT